MNIAEAVADATNLPPNRVWTLSLADDQLGYLIAPVEAYPDGADPAALFAWDTVDQATGE